MTTEAAVALTGTFRTVPLAELKEHPQNPRSHFDSAAIAELTASVREKGVLYPLLVRPNGKGYQILGGARRFRAAKEAGLTDVPVLIRELDDNAAFELMVVDNLQRADIHPLDEARAYDMLEGSGYDVAKIAARVGRSVKYVYDRMKLLALTPEAQKLFVAGKFTAGHAILLARLKPEDQKRAIKSDDVGGRAYRLSGLFTDDRGLFDPDDAGAKNDPYAGVKPVSVREFESWIRDQVRAEPAHVDGFLFPETVEVLDAHGRDRLAAILVTREYMAGDAVRHAGKDRVFGMNAWKRADGKERSKTCEWSRVGFVTCGPGQGEAFMVCVNKDKCTVHWAERVRAKQRRGKAVAKAVAKGEDPGVAERRAREEERAKREAEEARWHKAQPAIWAAIAAAVKKAPTRAGGLLAGILLGDLAEDWTLRAFKNKTGARPEDLVPRGKTTEDLVRHAAFLTLVRDVALDIGFEGEEFAKRARAFDVDAVKIVDQVAPPEVQTNAKPGSGSSEKRENARKAAGRR
jgi:ParB/RepB/Spo0J family partition protein